MLELRDVAYEGRKTCLNLTLSGRRSVLVGDWRWLRAHLAGVKAVTAGHVHCFGKDARRQVVEGRLGVSLAQLAPPMELEVEDWLRLNLRLAGSSEGDAKEQVRSLLSTLKLQSIAQRKLPSLNPAETFAAHLAFAYSTLPDAVVLGQPQLLNETRSFELGVLERLANACHVVLECAPEQRSLCDFTDELVEAPSEASKAFLPASSARPSTAYRVQALGSAHLLTRELQARGARVTSAPDQLLVFLPPGATTELIVASALASNTALRELVSAPEAE